MRFLTRVLATMIVLPLLVFGCGGSTAPPRIYTTAPNGASTAEELIESFKKAHAARDADAAMRMFYWESPGDQRVHQDVLRLSINLLFESPADSVVQMGPQEAGESSGPPPKTAIPVVARLRVTTNSRSAGRKEQTFMIGENEDGFYFVPPLNPPLDERP